MLNRHGCGLLFWLVVLSPSLQARSVALTLLFSSQLNGIDSGGMDCPGMMAVGAEVKAQRASGKEPVWIDAGGTGGSPCALQILGEMGPDVLALDRQSLTASEVELLSSVFAIPALNAFVLPDYPEQDHGLVDFVCLERDGIRILVTALLDPETPLLVPRDRMGSLGVASPTESLRKKLGLLREQDADLRVLVADAPWKAANDWNVLDLARRFPDFHIVVSAGGGKAGQSQAFGGSAAPRLALCPAGEGKELQQVVVSVDTITRRVEDLSVQRLRLSSRPVASRCSPELSRVMPSGGRDLNLGEVLLERFKLDAVVVPAQGPGSGSGERMIDWVVNQTPFDDLWYQVSMSGETWRAMVEQLPDSGNVIQRLPGGEHHSGRMEIGLPGRLLAGWRGETYSLRSFCDANPEAVRPLGISSRILLSEALKRLE